jgi:putative hydrolase of the HAD superfamily
MNKIEVIFFDLGNVILPFSHFQIAEKLSRHTTKKEFQDPKKIFSCLFDFENGMINDFDAGKVTPQDFFQSLKERFGLVLTYDDFLPIWNDIFAEDEEVSEIIRSLKGRRRLGLLSNTDVLHFNYILSRFPVIRIFDQWILSFEVGFKKPAVEIFRNAIEWAAVEPQNILFIDDMKIHVDAAISMGIQAIHFVSADQLRKELHRELKSAGQD